MSRTVKIVFLVCCIAISLQQLYQISHTQADWENPLTSFGTRDAIAFWAGSQAVLHGLDPYQSSNTYAFQHSVSPEMRQAQVFLNPPLSIPLLLPFFSWSFNTSRIIWIVANVLFALIAGFAVSLCLGTFQSRRCYREILASVLFLPCIMTIWMGQLSLFVLAALCLGIFALQKKQDVLAGTLFSLLIVKPHTLIPLGICFFIHLLREKRFKVFLTFFLSVICFAGISEALVPDVFTRWAAMDFDPLNYRTSSLSTPVRALLFQLTGVAPYWPIWISLIIGITASLYIASQSHWELAWETSLPPILCLSLLCAPYVWFYDYALLVPLQIALVLHFSSSALALKPIRAVLLLCLPQALVLLSALFTLSLEGLFWFPIALWLVWKFGASLADRQKS